MAAQTTKLKILLGLTGSVATVLYQKIILALKEQGYDVDVILTKSALHFVDPKEFDHCFPERDVNVFLDETEWHFDGRTWTKGDKILHIDLRDQYSALVIAPCSANTLAKLANGLCDNLLTSVARAWDPLKPFIIAPAMNTQMWDHPLTQIHLKAFKGFAPRKNVVVLPQPKMLACGTVGMGALAHIPSITSVLQDKLAWGTPFGDVFDGNWGSGCTIPISPHPGAFSAPRNGHRHTGVDLYVSEGTLVYPVEDGVVVGIEHFTGPQDNSPWWEDTDCVLVRGASGVVNYGEIEPNPYLQVGERVRARQECLGHVKRVIKKGKEHPEITGWKPSMLHIELYPWNATKASNGFEENVLRDPTPFLLRMRGASSIKTLTWEPSTSTAKEEK